jgi:hypothetical protein
MLLVAALACTLAPLGAQTPYWSEGFESYPLGQLASGSGGWYGWDNIATVMGDIVAGPPGTVQPQVLEINNTDDTIYPFVLNDPTGYPTSGVWRMSAWWYIPSSLFVTGSGAQDFLIQTTYNHGGPYTWAVQLEANPDTMMVSEYHTYQRINYTAPVVLDAWVLVQVDIDLDSNYHKLYYNNTLICEGTWVSAAADPVEIACLDLYTPSLTNTSYYDDIKLEQIAGDYQKNQPGSSLDVNGVIGSAFSPAKPAFLAGVPATLNLNSTNAGLFWDMALTIPEPSVSLLAGGFLTPGGQVVNINLFAPSLTFLNPGFGFAPAALPMVLPPIQITAQMVNADPALPDGIALSAANEITAVGCTNPQNFDSIPGGLGSYPLGWSDGGGTSQWTADTAGTPSLNTGPTAALSAPNYMYCETSGFSFFSFKMNTCLFDTTGMVNPTLNFGLSRIGATIGTLNVLQDDGSGTFPIVLATYTGFDPTQAQGVNEWSMESLPIDTTTPGAIPRFQFDYLSGSSFTGDIAIDDVLVQ